MQTNKLRKSLQYSILNYNPRDTLWTKRVDNKHQDS